MLALAPACSGAEAGPPPDRSPVESHIAAAPPADAVVAPAEPTQIELRTPAGTTYLSSPLHPEELMRGGPGGQRLDPVDERPVWWGESGLPGTGTRQTVVVVGHNYARRDAPFRALRVVEPGDRVVLRTTAGVLEYAVETAGPLPKGSLLGAHELRESVAGRLLLANCDVREGESTDDNYVVVAQLVRPVGT
ncbi:Sortase family protein [Rhodococcus tukisamuensis]|uniref:Sortase family protein n=1 Tax=Rhodococcus tukisamuensis TaxID=168276 RepID=A0A1G6MZG9_9NOCA|nr:Sortase family protein [Rhodococcus tukisamuensis]